MDRRSVTDGTEVAGLYARAVRVGPFVYVSGTTALDRDGGVSTTDAAGQTRTIVRKLEAALAQAGATTDDVVRIVIYVTDVADAPAVLEVLGGLVGRHLPAATLVEVEGLIGPDLRVEVQLDAVITGGD